jgi:hypothetical protein
MHTRAKLSAASVIFSSLVSSCGESAQISHIPSAIAEIAKIARTEKATGTSPVYRFAKISSGAYFYTASAAEAEQINQSYPDFRYEGVAYQHIASGGGLPVYRFAKLDTGGYFYTANEEEKAYVQSQLAASFRFEGISYYASATGGQTVYRLSNSNNGGYLFTTSAEEYAYAGSLPGWRQEGPAFNVPAGLTISGTVSDGTAWAQAVITVVDKNGITRNGTTNNIGTYFVDGTGLTAPVVALANYKQPGAIGAYMMAVLPTLPSNTSATTMNFTPLTDMVANYAVSASQGLKSLTNPTAWNTADQVALRATTMNNTLRRVLKQQLLANNIPATDFDPTRLAFAANNLGQAALIRDIFVSNGGKGHWISNRRSSDPAADSIYLANDNLLNVRDLPPSSKPAFPKETIDSLKAAWQTCLSIPAAERVVVSPSGIIQSFHPSCTAIASDDYISDGDSFSYRWYSVLRDANYTPTSIEAVKFRHYIDLDSKEQAVLSVHFLGSTSRWVSLQETFTKRNYAWVLTGNLKPITGNILARTAEFSRVVSGTTSTALEQVTSQLSFDVDPAKPNFANIRSVRVKGPGIPTDGIVLSRSSLCSTQNSLAIINKTGYVLDYGYTPPANLVYTANNNQNFALARTVTAGTNNWPSAGSSRDFADINSPDPAAIVPPFSKYTFEYFDFSASSATPFATYTVSLSGTMKNPIAVADYKITPSSGFVSDWLNPMGLKADVQPSVAFSWSVNTFFQPQLYSLLAYSSTRNSAVTSTTAADYFLRAGLLNLFTPADLNSSSTKLFLPTSLLNGVSTNSYIASLSGATNASCSAASQLRTMNQPTDYREFTFVTIQDDFTQVNYTKALVN